MQKNDLQSLDLKQLQDLLEINSRYYSTSIKIAQSKKFAATISAAIFLPVNGSEQHLKIKTIHFKQPEEIPAELRKFFEDWSTRLIGEKWLIEEAIDNLKNKPNSL
jgi:hypothetical protein